MIQIIPYSGQQGQVMQLLTELQKQLVLVDEENVQVLLNEYGEKYYHYVMKQISKNQGAVYLACNGDDAIGMIAGYIEPKDEEDIITNRCPKRGIVSDLIVSSSYRGQGIGKLLMHAMESFFEKQGCEFIAVDVFAPNVDANRFYCSMGYSPRNIELYKRIH